MSRRSTCSAVLILCAALAAASVAAQEPSAALRAADGSRFGDYKGIAGAPYDSWVRSSRYLTMSDGVRLAVDILRPAKAGAVEPKPLPALWTHTRYRRASLADGKVRSMLEAPLFTALLRRGYVMAAVDVRGSGASFGISEGVFTARESQDAYEITEWLASQPWCDGKIGMFGGSYLGITQLMAAATRPPHLKAIFPTVSLFDLYDAVSGGGVFRDDFVRSWSALTKNLDTRPGAAPVDEDRGGRLLREAEAGHAKNLPLGDILAALPFRDGRDPATGAFPYREWQPAAVLDKINASGIPVYIFGGWFDIFDRDAFLLWANLRGPKRLTVGPWSHSPRDPESAKQQSVLLTIESLRWFDHWLKGLDTGLAGEDPIFYFTMKGPGSGEWRSTPLWPPAETAPFSLYFGKGPSESVASLNDGRLFPDKPGRSAAGDLYTIDDSTTTGTATRWDNAAGGGFQYPDLSANDRKGLTYTTPPLPLDLEVTGHPVLTVWLSSTSTDLDVFAYLEEIDARGVSNYVSEGALRASLRTVGTAPYEMFGLPYHRAFAEDARPLVPGEPAELRIELQPTSNIFDIGHRLRLTLTFADRDNAATPILKPAPEITIHRDAGRPSRIDLPVVGKPDLPGAADHPALFLAYLAVFFVATLVIIYAIFVRKRVAKEI